jgi:hypothetical protein
MFQVKRLIPVVVFAALGGGCYQGIDGLDLTDEIAEMRETHLNGLQLNGLQLNGLVLNGLQLNGLQLNGLQLNGLQLNGLQLNGLQLNGLQLNGLQLNGLQLNGLQLNGSSIGGTALVNGELVLLEGEDLSGGEFSITAHGFDDQNQPGTVDFIIRINDIYLDDDYSDIHYYDLSLSQAGSDTWNPLCVDANNNPLPAIPLRNYWNEETGARIDDANVVTFACTSGVLAHCTQWGYRPWDESTQCDKWEKGKKNCKTVSLTDYHQACTRMARADYCGDGTPWTVPGTPIDIYDHLSPQIESQETKWPVEAEWNVNGAYCLDDIRQQAWKAQGLYPKCKKPLAKKLGDCGDLTKHRALLASRFEKPKKKK